MTAPGDDGERDPGRESGSEDGAAGPPPATERSSLDDESAAGPAETDTEEGDTGDERLGDEEAETGEATGGADGTPGTEGEQFSRGVAERHQQEREARRPPAVGETEKASGSTEEDESGATWKLFTRDIVTSVLAVALLGAYLFAISGVWPPMVAIESGSMEPNMEVNDLVFLMETDRFQPEEAHEGTGVVTAATGNESGYGNYGRSGDVIVFEPDGNGNTTPIIHRAMFWVEEGENWCEQADPAYLGGLGTDDEDCVASNDGFITKGDNNNRYDQASLQADRPVKPEWIVGTAEARIPRMGWFRLRFQ